MVGQPISDLVLPKYHSYFNEDYITTILRDGRLDGVAPQYLAEDGSGARRQSAGAGPARAAHPAGRADVGAQDGSHGHPSQRHSHDFNNILQVTSDAVRMSQQRSGEPLAPAGLPE